MSTKITEGIDAVCELIKEKCKIGFGISSPQALALDQQLSQLEQDFVDAGVFPSDWTHKHSIGKGNLASVVWIVFLPPGQTTQDGIYVSFCFGKTGNGLVTGCAISNTSKKKYSYVPAVKRENPLIDVDGTRPGTHYNDGYVNPLEVFSGKVDEEKLLQHICDSVQKCNEVLMMGSEVDLPVEAEKDVEQIQTIRRYWTYAPGTQANQWDELRGMGVVALDFSESDDLRLYKDEEELRKVFQAAAGDAASHKNAVRALIDFRDKMKPGDIVFAKKGQSVVVGVGRVTGDYYYEEGALNMRHRRKVDWMLSREESISDKFSIKTLTDITSCPGFVAKLADKFNLEDVYAEMLYRLWNDFLREWPLAKLRSMTLPLYNKIKTKDTFCYWIECVLESMGSVWGGSAYKFGIFEYDKSGPKALDAGASGDDQYRWYTKYGKTAEEAFVSVKSRLVAVAEAAASGDYQTVESIDFSPVIKWKVAFLYQDRKNPGVVDIYKKSLLMAAVGSEDNKMSMAELNARAVAMIPPGVDHFVWARRQWLKNNVKSAEQSADMKSLPFDRTAIGELHKAIERTGLNYAPEFVNRFVAALCAKPFVVLTGLSGSGKTKLAEAFASWMTVPGLENVQVVPVGADWTNNEHLLGYPNALDDNQYVMPDSGVLKLMLSARRNDNIPHFLLLDEMNLSHVERYFADFLSAMESNGYIHLYDGAERKGNDGTMVPRRFQFPENLYVIGTMNVDETTYMFSPKVLDRAQVVEFRVDKESMSKYLQSPCAVDIKKIQGLGVDFAKSFLKKKKDVPSLSQDDEIAFCEAFVSFFEPLSKLGSEFGYRTACEAKKFVAYYCEMGASIDDAIDAAVIQKLLPKLHGSQARLGPVLEKLAELCEGKYPLSLSKVDRMKDRLTVGFTSFAEA